MKIALIKQRYSLQHGGSERYCVNLARRLQEMGHDVTVIGETIDEDLHAEVEFIPVRVNRLTSSTRNQSFAENCGRAAGNGRFDVVYGLGRSFGLDVVRVTERLQSHWLDVYYRGSIIRAAQRLNPRHRTLIRLERTIYRSSQVRRIVTQSQLDRRLLTEYYGIPDDKICTIYNGVDTDLFHPRVREGADDVRAELGIEPGEPLLVFASMDFEGKGLRSIIRALPLARDRETRLLVLGTGPVERFRRFARGLGVEQRVIFAGRHGSIERCYGAGDLFVLPTIYEPFPNVNLEAMACGLPVLTTATHGGADLIVHGENGYLVPDSECIREMSDCLDHHFSLPKSKHEAMSVQCRSTAEHLTMEENVRQTLEVFEEIVRDKVRV